MKRKRSGWGGEATSLADAVPSTLVRTVGNHDSPALSKTAMTLKTLLAPAVAVYLLAPNVRGDISYTPHFDPASSAEAQQVANSVAVAAAFYNQHGSFNKHWNVYYNPGIPTAEGNYDGYMGFGGTRNERVVFHEASHTFGMGTHWIYPGLVAGGWKGNDGNAALADSYGGVALGGDNHAIWPGGFNYDIQPGDRWEVQVGTTKTPLVSYSAQYDGAALTGGGDSGTGQFLTFNLTGLGVLIPANATCYVEIAPLSGDPYFELNSSRTGTYGGGTAYRGTTNGTIGTVELIRFTRTAGTDTELYLEVLITRPE